MVCFSNLLYDHCKMENCCSICVSNFKTPCTLPCNHRFCSVCIATWLTRSASCPLCRCDCTEWSAKWAQTTDAPLVIQIHHQFPTLEIIDDDSDYDDFRTMLDALDVDLDEMDEDLDEMDEMDLDEMDVADLEEWYFSNPTVMFQPSPDPVANDNNRAMLNV
jgi:hypothetical protein